jgi:hypothetical protein
MSAVRPSRRVLLLLAGGFAVVLAIAAMCLLSLKDFWLAAIVTITGITALLAAAVAYLVANGDDVQVQAEEVWIEPDPAGLALRRQPVQGKALPVAELPPPYLAAVMKGARANGEALKARATQF